MGQLGLGQLGQFQLGTPESGSASSFEQLGVNTLSLSQQVTNLLCHNASVSDTLTLLQTGVGKAEINIGDSLSLTDEAGSFRVSPVTVAQSLSLVQALDLRGPLYMDVGQNLNLDQFDTQHKNPNHEFPGNLLELLDKASIGTTIAVSQMLELVQEGRRITRIQNVLSLVQSVLVGKGGLVAQTLELVEVLARQGIFVRGGAQSMSLKQSATYEFPDDTCVKKSYTPFVGAGTGEYTPPTTTAPTLVTGTLTLTYPFASPSSTLVLRNPEFTDRDLLNFNRINRKTRGGTLVVFADPNWPKTQVLSVQVDNLSHTQRDALITFLATSLGKEIGLLDWEGRQWRGLIVTPNLLITHVKRGDRSIEFDFQGALA